MTVFEKSKAIFEKSVAVLKKAKRVLLDLEIPEYQLKLGGVLE